MSTRQAWQRSITDDAGNLLTGVQISVFQQDGITPATIYSGLTDAAMANPFNTGVQTVARFYADPGLYVIRAFKEGVGTQEWVNVDISCWAVRQDDPIGKIDSLVKTANLVLKSKKLRLMQIGDSLTGSGTNPLSFSGMAYGYLSGISQLAGWVENVELDATPAVPHPGVLRTVGDGTIEFSFNGGAFGPKVDVSTGGFFAVPSAGGAGVALVKILKKGQPSTAKQDSITFATNRNNVQLGGLNTFAECVNARLSGQVEVFNLGISGDSVEGVAARWRQAFDLCDPDVIVVMIGTNNQPLSSAAADAMYNTIAPAIQNMAELVGLVLVGGLFPRAAIPQNQFDAMNYFSARLSALCDSNDKLKYWDAFPVLVDPASLGAQGVRDGAFNTDNLHLMPFGAIRAADVVVKALLDAGMAPEGTSLSRGVLSSDFCYNPNPLLLGSGGTGSGSNGVSGVVPANVAIGRTGGTQLLALSTVVSEAQNALRLQVSGATTANDRHEVLQNYTLPPSSYGKKVRVKVRAEIRSADLLNQFEFSAFTGGNYFLGYLGQGSRVVSGITPDAPFVIDYLSRPVTVPDGVSVGSLRLRIGTSTGGAADIVIREFSVVPG